MPLELVSFGKATQDDLKAQGSLLYRVPATALFLAARTIGTYQLRQARKSRDLMGLQQPQILGLIYKVQHALGWKPEYHYVDVRPTLWHGYHYSLLDPAACKAFLKLPRNAPDGFLRPGKAVTDIAMFITECFPGATLEDCIFTCKPATTKILHRHLQNKLKPECLENYFLQIKAIAAETLEKIPKSEDVNFSEQGHAYLTRVFGEIIFEDATAGTDLSAHIIEFKQYLMNKTFGKVTPDDEKAIEELKEKVRVTTDKILGHENDLFFLEGKNAEKMTKEQMKALIFVVLVAAQDNTKTALSAALHMLASMRKEEQEALAASVRAYYEEAPRKPFDFPFELHVFLARVLATYPPTVGIARKIEEDTCMTFVEEGHTITHKVIFPAGSTLSARIISAAKPTLEMLDLAKQHRYTPEHTAEELYESFSAFGDGTHACPGRKFTEMEIMVFLVELLMRYKITIPKPYPIKLKLQFTGVIEPDVTAVLEKT